jgi:hypothetical protein
VNLGNSGTSVSLRLDGYEFSGSTRKNKSKPDFDRNWLYVVGDVQSGSGDWTFRNACLLTYDVPQISSWLRGVVEGVIELENSAEPEPDLRFTEPDLAFGLVSCTPDSAKVRIYLSSGAQAPSFTEQAEFYVWAAESSVVVDVTHGELIDAAFEWDSAALDFPER